jgi:hypothetical protein
VRLPRLKINATQVIAWIALFVSLSGTVYAAAKINGKTIKVGSIPANRVKADSLTGAQVNEASLGNVPSASRAAEAKKADTAAKALETGTAAEASTATRADEAVRATTATRAETVVSADNADVADDAALLGGKAPDAYQSACSAGSVLAAATVHPDPNGPNREHPETRSAFTCLGTPIVVTTVRNGQTFVDGEYEVDFGPQGVGFPVVSAFAKDASAVVAARGAAGNYRVKVFSVAADSLLTFEPFSIAILRGGE